VSPWAKMGKLNFTWSCRPNVTENKMSNFTIARQKLHIKTSDNRCFEHSNITFLKYKYNE
ncbi:MAG: hypothetical protein IJF58_02535, partial [Clostridia bacterium]|nr:hypothetical protein [Clostridia bacterium]